MDILFIIFQAWLLVVAIGLDAFVCSFGYGVSGVKIPLKSVMTINLVCTALLAGGLFFGTVIGGVLPEEMSATAAFIILLSLGVYKIFDSTVKRIIRKSNGLNKQVEFSLLNLKFLLRIYANPEEADVDGSKELSPREAAPLAIALGLDGLSVGFGAGIAATVAGAFLITGLSLVSDIAAITVGCFLGNKVAKKISFDLSWLSGVVLIGLAFMGILT
ncbi:MAG: manganese efflux pump [Oscillospiraceae bacterium]|nr:manganese efflux pump [Oscillospiraceae bacterium]